MGRLLGPASLHAEGEQDILEGGQGLIEQLLATIQAATTNLPLPHISAVVASTTASPVYPELFIHQQETRLFFVSF